MATNKMTLSELQKFIAKYVTADKQAGTWTNKVNEFTNMIEKIGKQVTITGQFSDKLAGHFDGDNLPYGKIIEEYFMDLPMVVNYDDKGTDEDSWEAYKPSFEQAAYSYSLGRKLIPLVDSYDAVESSCIDATTASNLATDKFQKFQDAYTNVVYSQKEELIGNVYSKANALTDETVKGNMIETLAKPVDTETGEAFIESVKKMVEKASDRNSGYCLSGEFIGAAPSLVLVINQGIAPNLDVNTLAGAFHEDKLALGVETIVVDSLGSTADAAGVYAALVDERGIKVHNSYSSVRSDSNALKDKVRYVRHYENTGFISKYTFAHFYKAA